MTENKTDLAMPSGHPRFVPVDLTEMQDEGVLMYANEAALWRLGLALTWTHAEDGTASDLHIRQWEWGDGHREAIELEATDPVADERHTRFAAWCERRAALMPIEPEAATVRALGRP